MKELRKVGNKELVRVFTYKVNTTAREYEVHMFFSWDDMYKYHEGHHNTGNDKWIYTTSDRWEEVEYVERLQK